MGQRSKSAVDMSSSVSLVLRRSLASTDRLSADCSPLQQDIPRSTKMVLKQATVWLLQGAAEKSGPLNFFAVFSATVWDFNTKFYSFIY